jgi:hypothetical protein
VQALPTTFTKTTSGAELVSGIVGTVDIGSLITKVIEIELETSNTKKQLENINSWITDEISPTINMWTLWGSKAFDGIKGDVLNEFQTDLKWIANSTRDQLMDGALGYPATAGMVGQIIKNFQAIEGVSTIADILIGIPQQIAYNRAEKYWLKTLAPNYPNEADIIKFGKIGYYSKDQVTSMLRETLGISSADAEQLYTIRSNQVGVPNLYDAWRLVQKGLWNRVRWTNLAQYGFGFTGEDAKTLFDSFYYDMSPMELMRLSDLIPLDPSWLDKKWSAIGYNDEDKAVLKAAMAKRVVRDEITRIWSLLLDNYQWGLETETTLRDQLEGWDFSKDEIDLRVETGELMKLKLRVKLMRDAEVYLYRTGRIVETELLERLTNLGISKDIANSIVRYEAAKKGVDWEIPVD